FIPFELMRLACPLRQRHLIANQWFSNDERSLNMFALRRRREPPRKYRNSTGLNRGSETQMSNNEDLKVELEKLRAENEALKKTSAKGRSLKISEKGGLSVYDLGRIPVTLYKEKWNKLLDM